MRNFRNDPPGMGAPARSKDNQKALQQPDYSRNGNPVQFDWRERALRAYDSGRLDAYELRRIFGLHFMDVPGGAR